MHTKSTCKLLYVLYVFTCFGAKKACILISPIKGFGPVESIYSSFIQNTGTVFKKVTIMNLKLKTENTVWRRVEVDLYSALIIKSMYSEQY